MLDFAAIYQYLPDFTQSLWLTIKLTFISSIVGLILAIPLSLMGLSKHRLIRYPVDAFSYFFRGTPLLIQIYLLYFGASQFSIIRDTPWLWDILKHAYWCALIVFALNTAAYTIEILKGAIKNTPKGEIEAATACGMSQYLLMRRIVLPSAFRRALPAYNNEIIFMLHGTAQASAITLIDLTGMARRMYARTFLPFEAFLTAACFYLVLTFLLVGLFKYLEKRYLSYLNIPKI
ncbi:histidine ABC transporter permease [Gammaproteobacteria bacterium]|nr:histidine ABC transporter permease [Gammaproteobacteria bacterium]